MFARAARYLLENNIVVAKTTGAAKNALKASKEVQARQILHAIVEIIRHPITTVQKVLNVLYGITFFVFLFFVWGVEWVFGITDCPPFNFGC